MKPDQEAIRTWIEDRYGLHITTVRALPGELDHNYRVTDERGRDTIFKLMRDGCDPALVDLQVSALDYVAAAPIAARLPTVVPTIDGRTTARFAAGRIGWMLSALEGAPLAHVEPWTASICAQAGASLGRFDRALAGFDHPALHRVSRWDLARAEWLGDELDAFDDKRQREVIAVVHGRYSDGVQSRLSDARCGAIHGDGNEMNLLFRSDPGGPTLSGLIDLGDMVWSWYVAEPAIAAAYLMMRSDSPLETAAAVLQSYHRERPVHDNEIGAFFDLVMIRLAISATHAARNAREHPDNPYLLISQGGAWRLLDAFHSVDRAALTKYFMNACGRRPTPRGALPSPQSPLLAGHDLGAAPIIDGSVGGPCTRPDQQGEVAIGRFDEPQLSAVAGRVEARVTTGVEVLAPRGTAVHLPLSGVVENRTVRGPGVDVMVRHGHGETSFLIEYLGLCEPLAEPGVRLEAGDRLGIMASGRLRIRVTDDDLDLRAWPFAVPRWWQPLVAVGFRSPAPLIGLRTESINGRPADQDRLQALRARHFARNQTLTYETPLTPVRGTGHTLFDASGRAYLDAYNNVPHVGHANPHVVRAVSEQLGRLNTNTRYLQRAAIDYAAALADRLPAGLDVLFFVSSASEANELALRLARAATGARQMLVMDHGYHGGTTGAMDISPYKFRQVGDGKGPDWVTVTTLPDLYRGPHRGPGSCAAYLKDVAQTISRLADTGTAVCGFISECLPSVAGQIVLPRGYLAGVYERVRATGGVCIADDVQTALGRLGEHFWGFEQQAVVPDIAVFGKPLGNGYPLAAVATTRAIADAFSEGPEYFSTFGGSTAACVAGLAVLEELERAGMQANARHIGDLLRAGFQYLATEHEVIGDVRGMGLFWGLELVTSRDQREPATALAATVKNAMYRRGVLIGTDGYDDNVLKIRPPMTLDDRAADQLLEALDDALRFATRRV